MDLDVPSVQAVLNAYKPGTGLTWQTLFPLKFSRKFDIKGIEGTDGIPVTADRVAFNSKAPTKTRKKVGSWSGTLGKIAISRKKDEIDINDYRDAKTLAAANEDAAAANDLVDMVYDDYKYCNNGMDYRVELDSCRIATSGKQVHDTRYDGDDVTEDVIDFNIPSANLKGAATVWSNSNSANGLKDIIDAQSAVAATGAPKPMFAYMEKATFEALRTQKATAERLYPLAKGNALAVSMEMLTLDSVNSFMDKNGYPHIYVVDTYVTVEAKDGSQTTIKPWNPNVVVLSATKQLGWTYYKTVPSVDGTDAIQVYGSYYKTTRYGETNPMEEVTLAEAYVQCALINRRSMVLLNTANTTWNDGASA